MSIDQHRVLRRRGQLAQVHGRVVAVTGASAGVGRAVVREFAKRGESIALLTRGEVGLAATAAEVTVAGATGTAPEIGTGICSVVDAPLPRSVLAHRFDAPVGSILLLHNLADTAVTVELHRIA